MFGSELNVDNIKSALEMRRTRASESFDLASAFTSSWCYIQNLYNSVTHSPGESVEQTGRCTDCEMLQSDNETGFQHIPVCIQLYVFSLLSSHDLARLSSVCKYWNVLSNDELLWKSFLERDMVTWTNIGHRSNPHTYLEVNSDLSYKQIYIRCNPEINMEPPNFQLSSLFRSLLPKKPPKLVMFGPGLETNVRGITRKMIYNRNSPVFQVTGMFPGEFPGVGAGFNVTIKESLKEMKLITLYSATKSERENQNMENRAQRSRLLVASRKQNESNDGEPEYELQDALKELCRSVDGFIFIVESTADSNFIEVGKPELFAIMKEAGITHGAPLLVASCVLEDSTPRIPCIDVVKKLQLQKLKGPWKVHDVVIDSLRGIVPALNWLIESAQRK